MIRVASMRLVFVDKQEKVLAEMREADALRKKQAADKFAHKT